MSHLALYRKYRSQTFGDLVGQEHVVRTLQSAISRGKIAHSYLFTGPRGTGKTSTARLLAKALNCEKGPAAEPCNACQACTEITQNICMDVLEMDAASESGVDDVRESIVNVADYQPAYCRYRVYIIDEVHDLSRQAFDALLKTIEEPPSHVVFILATTEASKVPPTIRSRCQRYEFHRGSIQDLVTRLRTVADAEACDIEPAALNAIARMSDGGYRDALNLLEQAILTTEGAITLRHVYDQLGLVGSETVDSLLQAMVATDVPGMIAVLEETYRMGRDPRSLLESVMHRLADLTRACYGVEVGGLEDSAQEAALKAAASTLGVDKILELRAAFAEAHNTIRDVSIPRVWLEAELIRISVESRDRGVGAPEALTSPPVKPAAPPAKSPESRQAPPTAEAQAPSPTEAAPVSTGDPELDLATQAWAAIVNDLAQMSKVARERLTRTKVLTASPEQVTVAFPSEMLLEQFTGQTIEKAVREKWSATGLPLLTFVAQGKSATPRQKVETATVELPAEGERLAELVQDVFGVGSKES